MVVVKGCKYVYFCFNLGVCMWHYFEVSPRLEKSLHLLTCENLYLIYCLFSVSSLPCHLFPPVVLTCSSLFPSSILLSLSLTSPDDSRTPALAQTWPTLTWNTRCAEEEEEEEVMEGGREHVAAVHSLSMQSTEKGLNETAVVDQLFLTMKVWRDHFYMPNLFCCFQC